MGANHSTRALVAACPSRKYHRCFFKELDQKYPVTQFALPHMPTRCSKGEAEAVLADPKCTLPSAETLLHHTKGPTLKLCPQPPPLEMAPNPRMRCDSAASLVREHAVLLLGVPTSPSEKGFMRRTAIRESWMQSEHVGRRVVVCFLLSMRTPATALEKLREEHRAHGDMLFLRAPETPWLIVKPTKYSGGKRLGRGMPTFKQYAFFQYAGKKLCR